MEIRRTPRQTAFVCVTALVAGGLAFWNIRDGLRMDSTALLILGGVFTLWTVYILLDLVRRGAPVRIDGDGVTIRHAVQTEHIPFDRMTWVSLDEGRRAGIIAYRPDGADKERYAAIAKKAIGPDGVAALRDAIGSARPGLADHAPGEGTEGNGEQA